MTVIDSSHRYLLEHLETFNRMETCSEELRDFIDDSLKEVGAVIGNPAIFEVHQKLKSDAWYEFRPKALANWKGTKLPLLSLGIESVGPENLLHFNNFDPTHAYIYSPYMGDHLSRNPKSNYSTQFLAEKLPLDTLGDVEVAIDLPDKGYIATLTLEPLTAEMICDGYELKRYFSRLLQPMATWYVENEREILERTIIREST